jgi:hypothetical protein
MRLLATTGVLLATIMIASSPAAMACSCSSPTICDLIHAPILFVGEVIDGGITSIRQDPWDLSTPHVRLKVLERFRGILKDQQTVVINILQTPGMCAPNPYQLGRKYLVVPNEKDGKLYDGPCFEGRDVEAFAEDVRYIQQHFAGKMPINVRGQVAVTRHDDNLVDFLLMQGEAKPMAGVTLSASRQGKTYSTVTNANGRYILPLPSAGTYVINASLKPYSSEPVEVTISGRGCAIHDFGLKIENTISGRVLDDSGQPMKDAKVGLIDLDRLPSDSERHVWFDDAYVERDMNYRFANVPLGRYLLFFNPEGPHSGNTFNLPFESTFYPLDSVRANAKVIEVNSAGIHLTGMDLAVGRKVQFRRVSVRVKFPDGMKMKTAKIICTGLPPQKGEFPWIETVFALLSKAEDGSIEFYAPANRNLKLEVRDDYGRDLKGIFTSFHEAGVTPIMQEFIVKP